MTHSTNTPTASATASMKPSRTPRRSGRICIIASAGIPSGSKLLSWPIFLAAGVPVEALVVLKVIDAIPDIFKTLLNVTADLSITVIVQRFAGAPVATPVPVLATQTE